MKEKLKAQQLFSFCFFKVDCKRCFKSSYILGLTKRFCNDLHIHELNDAIKPSNSKLCVHSFIIKIIIQPITN